MKNKITIAAWLLTSLIANVEISSAHNLSLNKATKHIAPKRYNIAEMGAIGDSKTLNTTAIQAVIDKCAKNGGGTVVIPKGIFLTGSLFLKPGVNIEMLDGSVLKGSTDINNYPKSSTRIEGHFEEWPSALINADKIDHLRITGKGILDGSGEPFWKLFYSRRTADPKTTNLSVPRPRLALIQNCKDVKIDGISFTNSGFWNLHLYRCSNLTVNNCRFVAPDGKVPNDHAPSSDGIDVDSSQDITISNSFFSVGDDDIALKGSKGPFAMQDKDSPPVERIYIHDCVFEAGGGIMTCGSEATLVRDVRIERCTTRKPVVMRLKLRPDTPQQYENITISDITMENGGPIFAVAPWTQYFDLKGQTPPTSTVRNIKISNIKGTASSLGRISGNPGVTTFGSITLSNVNVTVKNPGFERDDFKGLVFENVVVNGVAMPTPVATVKSAK